MPPANNKRPITGGQAMSDREMLQHVLEIIVRVERNQRDDNKDHVLIRADISKIREEMAGNRVKWITLTSAVAMVVSGVVAMFFKHIM